MRTLAALILLFTAAAVLAQGRWEMASNVGSQPTGDPMLTRCSYQTLGGYRFSTNTRGPCPYTVEVNVETAKVRESQSSPALGSGSRWESAMSVGQEPTGDPMLTRCSYRTLGGYQFTVNQRGVCPYTVEVNPQSGEVKAPNGGYGGAPSAMGRWQSAQNIGQETTGDPMLIRCSYQTLGGYRFSTTARGVCPYSVQVDPETREVRQ